MLRPLLLGGPATGTEECVRAFDGRKNALVPAARLQSLERLIIRRRQIANTARGEEQGVLRAHAGIVQTGGDGVRLLDLAVLILQQHGETAVQHAGTAERQGRRVVTQTWPATAGLDSNDLHARVGHERMEGADGVRSAADARDDRIRKSPGFFEHLRTGLTADHRLQLAYEIGIRMRTDRGADQIVRIQRIGHPGAQSLVDRRAQRTVAAS